MKKYSAALLFFFLFFAADLAAAESEVHVLYGETYYCGDSLEIIIPDEPVITTLITRNPGSKVIQARAGKDDILLEVRVQVRNMSSNVYKGISPESFKLVGYVRGRPLSYTPEIMEPYDYGNKRSYYLYDKMYFQNYVFAPLRKIDMILVYRINPILRDLELHVNPKGTNGTDDRYLDAVYPEKDLEPCDGVFQFITIRNAETGEITKYYR